MSTTNFPDYSDQITQLALYFNQKLFLRIIEILKMKMCLLKMIFVAFFIAIFVASGLTQNFDKLESSEISSNELFDKMIEKRNKQFECYFPILINKFNNRILQRIIQCRNLKNELIKSKKGN